ncbi:MAG: hypothetical protein ACJASZ_000972 [Yoonia sp.]|jgi:hypothetical protein
MRSSATRVRAYTVFRTQIASGPQYEARDPDRFSPLWDAVAGAVVSQVVIHCRALVGGRTKGQNEPRAGDEKQSGGRAQTAAPH